MISGWAKGLSAFETPCTGFLPFSFFPLCIFPQNKKCFVVFFFFDYSIAVHLLKKFQVWLPLQPTPKNKTEFKRKIKPNKETIIITKLFQV